MMLDHVQQLVSDVLISARVNVRYNSLSEPMQSRRDTLEAWQVLFQFYRDLDEEVAWLSDRLPSIAATDWGSSLSSTQQLLHKHQVTDVCSLR